MKKGNSIGDLTNERGSTAFHYVALLLAAFLIWINFPQGRVIASGDLGIPFYRPTSILLDFMYMWVDYNCGVRQYGFPRLTYFAVLAFLNRVGFSPTTIDRLYMCLCYFLAGASMYYLVSSVFNDESKRGLAGLFSGLVYMYNPYTMIYGAEIWYSVVPFILGAYMKGLASKSSTKYSIYIAVAFFATNTAFPTYSHIISTIIPPLLYTLFCALHRELNFQKVWFAAKTATLLVVANIWWLVPTWLTYTRELLSTLPLMEFSQTYSTVLEVMRWLGTWQIYAQYKGMPYVPYGMVYVTNPCMILVSMVPICLSLYLLIAKPRDRSVLFFSGLTVVALFLSKGRNPPLGQLYDWLLTNLPFFIAYRESIRFVLLTSLGFSFLVGIATADLAMFLRRITPKRRSTKVAKYLASIGLVTLILLPAWPIFTGYKFVNWYNPPNKGFEIPSYYKEANAWFDEHSEFSRLLIVPPRGVYVAYTWGYQGISPSSQLFSKPVIEPGVGRYGGTSSMGMINLTYSLLANCTNVEYDKSEDRRALSKLIGLLNVEYIVLETDLDTDFYDLPKVSATAAVLNSSPWNGPIIKIGELWIYKNTYFAPRIYAASDVQVIDNFIGMKEAVRNDSVLPGRTAIFLSSALGGSQVHAIENVATRSYAPAVFFERISPTRYVVHVENASYPFVLILSDSYDDGWMARIDGNDVPDHMLVNGFANAWLLKRTGSFRVLIEYRPQTVYIYSSAVSIVSLAICLIVAATRSRRQDTLRKYVGRSGI